MSGIILSKIDGSEFEPRVMKAVRQYGGNLYHQVNDVPHPVALMGYAWNRLQDTLIQFEHAHRVCVSRAAVPLSPEHPQELATFERAAKAYEKFIYEAVELVENMNDNLKACVLPKKRWGEWRPKGTKQLRKHMDMICNKLKHNGNRMLPIEVTQPGARVPGYSICELDENDILRPNRNIHVDADAFSYNLDLRRALASIYLIGETVGREVEKLGGQNDVASSSIPNKKTVDMLAYVSELPSFVYPGEGPNLMPIFEFDGVTLRIEEKGGVAFPPKGPIQTVAVTRGDGHTKSFYRFFAPRPNEMWPSPNDPLRS